ncbi:Coenzyme F420 hydrogenase/dehydrogenase, beta subunit C-terminal domain [Jannaschia seohaensis]|uniref:Coenzyme F420 hydrogenase subunit beta n=1 Tax=Jannaschia seohaensis TaxID=475081 RepID=A0A2Y9B2F0_9RHOB|nr:Coenzyme F420 hydrogenase/dehydrogenase, beta subunit C-terminal domain [Jannaschia seohaensis]PWJ12896.1 coenzyme F420 hydrogenase subunit beta [Jannaschia seohaensis]SSA50704.1 coenzyme F420 hydrogenase subunit beta [Jannaschia seohaensis]
MTDRSANRAGRPASPVLARVARGELCAGCGGCVLAAPGRIEMRMTPPGVLRPQQTAPLDPAQDERIARICPGLGQRVSAQGRRDHPLWGPYLDMQVGHATDPALRHRASSGGGLSAVAAHLIETGAVDGVVQTGADPRVAVANVTRVSRDAEAVAAAAGSRYAPSAPLAGLGPLLEGEGRYAFVGKPCDVVALRALAREDPRVAARFPVVLSFFCAGVPAQAGAEAVLARLGADPDATVAFRYRGHGWPGRATARLADGTERSMSYHDSWGRILSRHLQPRCKLCADGTGVEADLVFADAWESDANGYPLFEERDGQSLIVTRTEAGARLLEAARAAGRIETRAFDPAGLAAIQTGQFNRRTALLARLAALWLLRRPIPRYRGLRLGAAARLGRPSALARNFLGTLRRGIAGRL